MRLKTDLRRTVIITAAVRVARDTGLIHVNHGSVAKRCVAPTSSHTVRHYFATQEILWRAVIEAAPDMAAQGKEIGL